MRFFLTCLSRQCWLFHFNLLMFYACRRLIYDEKCGLVCTCTMIYTPLSTHSTVSLCFVCLSFFTKREVNDKLITKSKITKIFKAESSISNDKIKS